MLCVVARNIYWGAIDRQTSNKPKQRVDYINWLLRIHDWWKCPQEIKETQEQEQVESVVVENGEGGCLTVSYFILFPGDPIIVCMN